MESIKVTPENLTAKAREVDAKADNYYNSYKGFLQEMQTLTSTDWTGEDATAFFQRVAGFEDDFQKMKQLMNDYAAFMRQAAQNYEATQANIKGKIRGLQN